MNALLQKAFAALCEAEGLPRPIFEVQIKALLPRRWRYDIGFPDQMVLVEVEGGAFQQGRHVRGKGFLGDMEKYNAAEELGYHVLRYTPQQILTLEAIHQIQRVIQRGEEVR